jgi:DNA-binding NarL/FixJ family response regulator
VIPHRVVLAEDNVPLRTLLRFAVDADPRFTVVGEAADGVEALELLETHDPDLLLLDLSMPVMDGLEVLEKLVHRTRPLVAVLTGFEDPDLEHQVLQAGAAVYLTKGSAFDGLVDRLDQLLA